MAEINLFSPRKVTSQNERHLPHDHDPNKRTTYVQITLDENEIAEAIRNYIRAQIPVRDGEELPVVLTAGRGENGHSAAITLQADPVYVQTVERPTAPMATFTETAAAAARRNEDEAGSSDEAPTSSAPPRTAAHKNPAHPNPNRLPDAPAAEAAAEEDQAEPEDTPVDDGEPSEDEVVTEETPVEEAAPPAPAQKSNLFGEPVASSTAPATKGKSIFDSLS